MLKIFEIVIKGRDTLVRIPAGGSILQVGEHRGYVVLWTMADAVPDKYDYVRAVVAKNGDNLDELNISGLVHQGSVIINDVSTHVFLEPY